MYRGQVLEGTALDRSGSRWAGVDGSTRDALKSLDPSALLTVETTRQTRQVRVRDISHNKSCCRVVETPPR